MMYVKILNKFPILQKTNHHGLESTQSVAILKQILDKSMCGNLSELGIPDRRTAALTCLIIKHVCQIVNQFNVRKQHADRTATGVGCSNCGQE
jgi:hypothetical protein